MPRSVAGVYSLPSGSIVANGQISAADQHNDPLNDIVSDLNTARPVVAGGTGVTSLASLVTALSPLWNIVPFRTRALFITWAASAEGGAATSGTVVVVGSSTGGVLAFIKDGGATITDAAGWSPLGNTADLNHFRAATSASGGNTAWTNAAAWLNEGSRFLTVRGDVNISQPIPALTGDYWGIDATGGRLLMQSGTSGNFFTFGTSSEAATRFYVRGISCQCNNTPGENDYAFDFVNAVVFDVQAQLILGACAWRLGSATEKAQQGRINITGNLNKGLNANANTYVLNASAMRISGTWTGSGGACNTNTAGALCKIAPVAGQPCDTLWFEDFSMQMFNNSTPGSSDGKPYGLIVNLADESVTNIFFVGMNVFDHTTVAALSVTDDAGSTNTARDWNLTGLRLATDAGRCIRLDKNSADTVIWSGWSVTNNFCNQVAAETAVWIDGVGWRNCIFSHNRIVDDSSATAKARAMLADGDNWVITSNAIGDNTANGTGFAIGIEITNTAATDMVVADNLVVSDIPVDIKLPTFASASPSRVIRGRVWKYTATYDPPPLAVGNGSAIQTVTAQGATVGQPVVVSFSNALQGVQLAAWVSAPDVVSYYFLNPTGNPTGTVNLASGTVTVSLST